MIISYIIQNDLQITLQEVISIINSFTQEKTIQSIAIQEEMM